ncbi:MAG: MoaD/ThiS family protein [Candidatus Bathyarchaeia archaeon]
MAMVTVTLEYTLKFRSITGKDLEKVTLEDKTTIGGILELLKLKYGDIFEKEFANPSGDKIAGAPLLLLNGRALKLPEGLNTYINDGDIITFTYAIAGG